MEQWNSVGRTMGQCWWNSVVIQCNIVNKTRNWDSEKVMVEQWHSVIGTVIVEKWKYVGIRVLLEQWNSVGGTVRWNSAGGRAWWNRGTVLVEQWNSVGGTVVDEQCGGTVEQSWWNTHSGKVKQR